MAARRASGSSGRDLAGDQLRDAARGEIQALLGSPELRRIFDDEPPRTGGARLAAPGGRRGADAGRPAGPADAVTPPARTPRSRKTRIAIGLAPVYLAALILVFEVAREPSLLDALGTPGAAEETSPQEATGEYATFAFAIDLAEPASEGAGAGATAPAPVNPGAGNLVPASAEITDTIAGGKSSGDIAKGAGMPPAAGPGMDLQAAPGDKAAAARAAAPADAQGPSMARSDSRQVSVEPPYPAALGDEVAQAEAPVDPAASAAAEEALRLSRSDRREVQRRLRFADFDPRFIDGIFGPATRSAIAAWQDAAGLPATGYVDERAMAVLVEQTADDYRAWRSAERARARREEAERSAVVVSSARPWQRAAGGDGCRRLPSGELVFGGDARCNFRAFRENLKKDFQGLKGNIRELLR